MKDPKHIMGAIDLLQTNKVKKTLPWWLVPVGDARAVACLAACLGGCGFLRKSILSWL